MVTGLALALLFTFADKPRPGHDGLLTAEETKDLAQDRIAGRVSEAMPTFVMSTDLEEDMETSQDGSEELDSDAAANMVPSSDTPTINNGPASTVVFPQHHAPLRTDRGGEYFAAQLVLRERCLRAEVASKYEANDPVSWLLIWPNGFTFATESETVRVVDELGRVVAQIGDHIRLSRAEQATERELVIGTVEGLCRAPFPGGRRGERLRSRVRGH